MVIYNSNFTNISKVSQFALFAQFAQVAQVSIYAKQIPRFLNANNPKSYIHNSDIVNYYR